MLRRERAMPHMERSTHPFLASFLKKGTVKLSTTGAHSIFKLKGMTKREKSPIPCLLKPSSVNQIDNVLPIRGSGSASAKPIEAKAR